MYTTPFFQLQFQDKEVALRDLPAFRRSLGSVVHSLEGEFRKAGIDDAALLFNRRLSASGGHELKDDYPLTQYKNDPNGPCIVGFGAASQAVQLLADALPNAESMARPPQVKAVRSGTSVLRSTEHELHYKLYDWVALSGDDHKRFTDARIDLTARVAVLQRVLDRHIRRMVERLYGQDAARHLPQARLQYLDRMYNLYTPAKDKDPNDGNMGAGLNDRAKAFELSFSIPLELPCGSVGSPLQTSAGLGRFVAHGFGHYHRKAR